MWPFFLSIKYFLSKRKEGMISLTAWISVLGVALGTAALIIVLSVMNGFDLEVKEKIIGTYAHAVILKDDGIADQAAFVADIKKVPGVENAAPFITGQAVLRKGKTVTGVLVKGIDPEKEKDVNQVLRYTGGAWKDLKNGAVILGSELLANQGITSGDEVELLVAYSPLDTETIKLTVIGGFSSGRYDYDSNIVIVDLDTAMKMFRTNGTVSGVALKAKDEMAVNALRDRLQAELGYPYFVKSWMDLDKNLVSALALEKKMMFLILGLIVMVACFNISSSLIMMVMEKTRDIGILKAIGANSRGVSLVFILEGMIIGMSGVIAGGIGGVYVAKRVNAIAEWIKSVTGWELFPSDVYYFTEIPSKVSDQDVVTVISVAIILTLAAGIYPAWRASRLDPVEAIRYE